MTRNSTSVATPTALLSLGALLLSACASSPGGAEDTPDEASSPGAPVVLTTFTVLQDIVSEVGGDRVEVRSIAPPGAEVHEYDPTPSDVRDAEEADLIIANGLGLEAGLEQFLAQSQAPTISVAEDVDPLPVTRLPDHPDADTEMPVNPHAWMSPQQGMHYVDAVEAALIELSEEDAEHFSENARSLRDQLEQLGTEARERVEGLEDLHLVTCEGAFSYLAEDLGIGEHYLWPLNADSEGSPQQVEAQIRYVQDHEVETIFCESTVDDSAQQQVAEASGAELGDPLYVDSLTEGDGPVPTYLELLQHDIDLLLEDVEP